MSDDFTPPNPPPPPLPPPPGQAPQSSQSVHTVGQRNGVFGTHKDLTFWVLVGSAVLVFIGSFLPWAKVSVLGFSGTVNGTEGDGVLTIILGLGIGVAAGLLRTGLVKPASIVALASSAIAGLIALYDMINIDQFGDGYIAGASIGFGLLLVGFAAFIGFVTALVELLAAFGVLAAKQSDSA